MAIVNMILGNGRELFETDQMRNNLEKWRSTRALSEDTSFFQYTTDLLLGNYTIDKPTVQTDDTTLANIMTEVRATYMCIYL